MTATKIMIIRHAEKPDEQGTMLGVNEGGSPDPHQLTVRGWQRAGALVRFFAPIDGKCAEGIATPKAIFASKSSGEDSLRPVSTVTPLAAVLGIAVNDEIGKGEEEDLVEAVKENASEAVLICWRHEPITEIVRGFAGNLDNLPVKWPGKRFDLVWVLDYDGVSWRFSQVPQLLLAGDEPASVVLPLAREA